MRLPDRTTTPSRPTGFTLVELVVVMAVLTVLAGLVLPKLDVFKLKANKASAASNMHGVNRFVTTYKVQRDLFPDGFDSLLDSTATTNLSPILNPQCLGTPPANPTKLTTATIATTSELRSLNRVGLTVVYDLDTGAGFPGNAGTVARTLAVGDTYATINAADPDGQAIIQSFYPATGAVPAGSSLVVFGLGPRNEMVGDVLHRVPFYANADQTAYYNRYLVVFEMSSSGGRAKLIGTLGSDGDTLNEEIADFYLE